jgi:hypothetical protein
MMVMFVVVMMVVLMLVVIVIIIVIVMMVVMLFFLMFKFITALLNLLDPRCAGGYTLKVKHAGVENILKFNVTVITFEYACAGLQCAYNLADAQKFVGTDLGCLVKEYYVAELYLLDYQVFQILLTNVLLDQVIAAAKLVTDTQGIDNGYYAVKAGYALLCIFGIHARDGIYGLGYRAGLADAAGFNDYVVKTMQGYNLVELLHKVHLEGAADATVLQGYQAVIVHAYDASLLDKACVDVYLTYIIYYYCKLDTLAVGQYSV